MYTKSKESSRNSTRRHTKKIRLMALLKLGGKCALCEIDDVRLLEFDHINNNGAKDRKSRNTPGSNKYKFHKEIIAGKREDIQLLCANCHKLKTWKYFSVEDNILGFIM